jgi:multiple sugar transport system substrate-binding protein
MFMRDTHIGRYGSAGALLDLTPFLDDGAINTDALGDTAVADGTVDEGVYGLPTHYVGQATLYDAAKLTELGVDLADLETWDGYAEVALAATDPASGYYGTADPTTGATHRHFESWIRQAGEELFTDEGEIGFTAETAEAWFQFWADLRDAGAAPPADIQKESEASGWTNDLLVTGKAALRPSSTNHLTIVQGLTENDIGLAGVAANADATEDWRFFPPILISAAANTEYPEEAAELIDFLINNVDAAMATKLSQGAPSSSEVREGLLPELSEDETEFITQISEEQELPTRPFPIRPEGAEAFNAEITRAGEEIAYGRLSVEESVAQLLKNGERVLAENRG